MYAVVFSEDAKKDLKELHKKAPLAINKLSKLLVEMQEHPRTGTGHVEVLKGYDGNVYSRRITSGCDISVLRLQPIQTCSSILMKKLSKGAIL